MAGTGLLAMPEDLYTIDALLGGWDPDDELSYATTFDARTYLAAHAGGLDPARGGPDLDHAASHG